MERPDVIVAAMDGGPYTGYRARTGRFVPGLGSVAQSDDHQVPSTVRRSSQ